MWGSMSSGSIVNGPMIWLICAIVCRAAHPPAITYAVAFPSSTGVMAVDAKGNVYLANSTVTGLPTPGAPYPSQDSSWGWTSYLGQIRFSGTSFYSQPIFLGVAWSIALDQGGNPFVAVEPLSMPNKLRTLKLDAAEIGSEPDPHPQLQLPALFPRTLPSSARYLSCGRRPKRFSRDARGVSDSPERLS